jgi:hypothetical protein
MSVRNRLAPSTQERYVGSLAQLSMSEAFGDSWIDAIDRHRRHSTMARRVRRQLRAADGQLASSRAALGARGRDRRWRRGGRRAARRGSRRAAPPGSSRRSVTETRASRGEEARRRQPMLVSKPLGARRAARSRNRSRAGHVDLAAQRRRSRPPVNRRLAVRGSASSTSSSANDTRKQLRHPRLQNTNAPQAQEANGVNGRVEMIGK